MGQGFPEVAFLVIDIRQTIGRGTEQLCVAELAKQRLVAALRGIPRAQRPVTFPEPVKHVGFLRGVGVKRQKPLILRRGLVVAFLHVKPVRDAELHLLGPHRALRGDPDFRRGIRHLRPADHPPRGSLFFARSGNHRRLLRRVGIRRSGSDRGTQNRFGPPHLDAVFGEERFEVRGGRLLRGEMPWGEEKRGQTQRREATTDPTSCFHSTFLLVANATFQIRASRQMSSTATISSYLAC